MKKTFLSCLCCALLAAGLQAAEKPGGAWDVRLRSYAGSVLVRPAGTRRWVNAHPGLPMKQGDLVRTGKKSSADLSLDGKGLISLNASTEFLLKDPRRKDSVFTLSAGRFIAKVTGLSKLAARMSIRTPTAVCAVRGTEFGVAYDKEADETLVNVFEEGMVEVTSLDENGNPVGETISVIPRNEVRVKKEMEAMTLAPSPAQRYKDPGIFSVRKKLSELGKAYTPLEKSEREELRGELLGGSRHAKASAAGDGHDGESGQGGAAEKGAGQKGGAEARGGAGHAGERGADGSPKASAGQGGASRAGAGAADDDRRNSDYDGGRKARARDDESGDPRHLAGGHNRKKGPPGRGGGDDGRGPLAGGPGGKARAGAGTQGAGDGARTKSAGDGPPAGRVFEGALSRPSSPTDKSVDTAVSRVQQQLSATGNESAIPSSELRAMVVSAAKTSASDASFQAALNASLAERLALAEAPSLVTTRTSLAAPQTSVSTAKTSIVGVTSPNITTPVMTNTSLTNTSVTNTTTGGTTIKKK